MNYYLLLKSLHLIAIVSWMAGLLYLPRIFVYHAENYKKKEATEVFETMERKLYFYIMRPAMIASWLFGFILIYISGFEVLSAIWLQVKLLFVIILSAYHKYLGKCMKSLKDGTNTKSSKFLRTVSYTHLTAADE